MMSKSPMEHRPALGGRTQSYFKGVTLEALPEGHLLHALGRHGQSDATDALARVFASKGSSLRPSSPGQWYIVGNIPLSAPELRDIAAELSGLVTLVDQSHGRVRIGIHGEQVTKVLSKGSAVDFGTSAFPLGTSTTTLIGHIPVHVTRMRTDAFEFIVMRSFAINFWDDLSTMCGEFR